MRKTLSEKTHIGGVAGESLSLSLKHVQDVAPDAITWLKLLGVVSKAECNSQSTKQKKSSTQPRVIIQKA